MIFDLHVRRGFQQSPDDGLARIFHFRERCLVCGKRIRRRVRFGADVVVIDVDCVLLRDRYAPLAIFPLRREDLCR